jgi:hypothetical protein
MPTKLTLVIITNASAELWLDIQMQRNRPKRWGKITMHTGS